MKKRIVSFALSVAIFLILFLGISAPTACAVVQSGSWTYTASNNNVTISGYTGPGGAVQIPPTINNMTVVALADNAFINNSFITSVSMPDTITSIGKYSFGYCISMTSIQLNNKITVIPSNAFVNSGLKSIVIPDSVASIEDFAFSSCNALTDVAVGKNVNSIGDFAFQTCTKLENISLPDSLTAIPKYAFNGCSALKNIKIPYRVSSINEGAFLGCTALENIELPYCLISIGDYAFTYCSALTKITIPKYVVSIGAEAFNDCTNLSKVYFMGNAPTAGTMTFFGCSGSLTMYYLSGSSGFTNPWCVIPTATFQEYYAVAFVGAGNDYAKVVKYDELLQAPATPSKTGNVFKGWYTAASGGNKLTFPFYLASNGIIYAQWTPYTYTVTFDSQGGTAVTSKSATYDTAITEPTAPAKTGYTFGGWYNAATGGTKMVFPYKVIVNTTFYAHWTANTYTVTYNSQGGTAVASKTAAYNTTITAPTNPTKSGYILDGWYTAATGGTKITFPYTITGNITLYAQWVLPTPANFKVTPTSYTGINVTWSAASGATGYQVYRSTSQGGTYTLVKTTTATSFSDTGLANGTTYYYKVRAYKYISPSSNVFSNYTAIISAKPVELAIPASVKAAIVSKTSIKLSWNAVSGATGYQVYRSTSQNGTYTLVNTTTATSFTNTGLASGTTYYYKVRAYVYISSNSNVFSKDSAVVSIKPN